MENIACYSDQKRKPMSISLPTNKTEKRLRLTMLYKQGSITQKQAFTAYANYCRLYDKQDKVKK